MLTTILNSSPPPKCVIIQDFISNLGKDILLSIIKTHLDLKKYEVHFFAFETNPVEIKSKFANSNLKLYDCVSDSSGWIHDSNNFNLIEFVQSNQLNGLVVIDSLAHVILEYGVTKTHRLIHKLSNTDKNITQVATVLHEDTLTHKLETLKIFNHVSTLYLNLHSIAEKSRVQYTHKKPGGKIIKQTEEYYFEENKFKTTALEKIDPKVLLANTTSNQLPENMSTFKISLDENEKRSREKLLLPYMKKSNLEQSGQEEGGNIIYNLDDIDDWDDEDPDDDLDI